MDSLKDVHKLLLMYGCWWWPIVTAAHREDYVLAEARMILSPHNGHEIRLADHHPQGKKQGDFKASKQAET